MPMCAGVPGRRSTACSRSSPARLITACLPARRAAPTSTRCAPRRSLELSGIARMLWGKGFYGTRFHALPQLALCLRDHGLDVPRELTGIACHGGRRRAGMVLRAGPEPDSPSSTTTRPAISPWDAPRLSLERMGLSGNGAAPAPRRAIPTRRYGSTIRARRFSSGYGRPSYWGGCGSLPRVHQYRDLAVVDCSAALPSSPTLPMPGSQRARSTKRGSRKISLRRAAAMGSRC